MIAVSPARYASSMCGCPSSALCALCLDGRFAQLRGVAACRGEAWATAVALQTQSRAPWPTTEKMLGIARRKVEDLARDPRLLEMLVGELVAWAARRWESRLALPFYDATI